MTGLTARVDVHLVQDSLNGTNHGAIGGWEDNKERDNEPRARIFLLEFTNGVPF